MRQRTTTSTSLLLGIPGLALLMASCTGNSQSPGLEYMPDMYRSPAIEAYVDYGQDPYHYGEDLASQQRERPSARVPAEGTIPYSSDPSRAAFNMPYPFPNTTDGYEAAGAQLRSPIAMTQASVDQGKILYDKFCQQCHGATGQGDGPVVTKGNHPPPGAYSGPLRDLPEGKMFHSITYGKGAMGPHAPLLNKEERWLVVQYVKFLQAGGQMPGTQAAAPAAGNGPGAAQ
jgi:mono/diheme cytochrome c family protein